MDISQSFKGLQGNMLQIGLSQEEQRAVQGKISCQRMCSEGGYWLQLDFFSLVVKHVSIRILLKIVVQFDLDLEQMDVKIIFLHGQLEKKIYLKQLEGYIQKGKENKVYLI